MDQTSELMRPIAIGQLLGVTTSRVYQLLSDKKTPLPHIRLGRAIFVRRTDWQNWLEAHGVNLPVEEGRGDGQP